MSVWNWVWIGLGVWVSILGIGLVIRLFIYKESVALVKTEKEEEVLPIIETNKTAGGAIRHDITGEDSVADSLRYVDEDTGDDAFAGVMDEISRRTTSPQRISKIKTKKVPATEAVSQEPPKTSSPPAKPAYRPAKETVVTDKTRGEIDNMITGIKSLSKEIEPAHLGEIDLNDPELEHLRESQIVRQLAATLVSEVKSEEASEGKYSKMNLDASLFFDEEDAAFFEKEFEWNPEDEDSITDKELKKGLSTSSESEKNET